LLRQVASAVYSRVHGWAPAMLKIASWSCFVLLFSLIWKISCNNVAGRWRCGVGVSSVWSVGSSLRDRWKTWRNIHEW
jgi:hypothetical protein